LNKIAATKNKAVRCLATVTRLIITLDKKDAPMFSDGAQSCGEAFRMANLTPRDLNGADRFHDFVFPSTEIVATKFSASPSRGKASSL